MSHTILKNNQPIIIAAHNGNFHADDVFAVATILLALATEKNSGDPKQVSVIRTRDEAVIVAADYVVDVGGVHDPLHNRFDHHQLGGAGQRANGIPYAAFGLVWQSLGEKVCGSKEVAIVVDQRLVTPADAVDNGVSISREVFPEVKPYDISSVIGSMNPNWNEDKTDTNSIFMNAVEIAKNILLREIISSKGEIEGEQFVIDVYDQTQDKRLIIFDGEYPWGKVLSKFPEPTFVVYPKEEGWRVAAVRNNLGSFENRKNLPTAWAGLRGAELSALIGIPGCTFCHNKLFKAGAETKQAAVAMATLALES